MNFLTGASLLALAKSIYYIISGIYSIVTNDASMHGDPFEWKVKEIKI